MEILSATEHIIYDVSVHQKLQFIHYIVTLATAKAIRRTSTETPCHELSFKSFKSREW